MAKLFANSGDPEQTPHPAASDLVLHYLPLTLLGNSIVKWVNVRTEKTLKKKSRGFYGKILATAWLLAHTP